MENTNQPRSPTAPSESVVAIEGRLSALERQMAERSADFGTAAAEQLPLGRADLSAELERHRNQLRDYEKALVERIADVDDDRRATTSRLQRAWQTQREEIDERLRRHAGLIGGLLILFAVLSAIAIVLVYRQATTEQAQVAAEVTEIRQQLAQLTGKHAVDELVQEKLEGLTAQLGEIASFLGRLDNKGQQDIRASVAAERTAREKIAAGLTAEIRRLDAEQRRLAEALEPLQSAPQPLEAGGAEEPGGTDAVAATPARAPLASDLAPAAEAASGEPPVDPESEDGEKDLAAADAKEPGGAEAAGGDASASGESDVGAFGAEETVVAPPGSYALQLIGFFSRKSMGEFVARDGLPARVYYFRQTYRDRPWHVIIHSLHEDIAAAEEALSGLPPDLAALNPWIRPLSEGTELQMIETGPTQE